jgi:hypothetical protein
MRRKGEFYCRVNDQDVLVTPADKSAEKMAGYFGVQLSEKQSLIVAAFELLAR